MEACFRQHKDKTPPAPPPAGGPDPSTGEEAPPPPPTAAAEDQEPQALTPSSQAFDEDVSGPLATAVIRSLRFFRAAAAGTEAASSVPGPGEEQQAGGGGGLREHTPAVTVLPDGSVAVDDGHRRVALAGLRLAGAVATAPGPARALLAAGGFHVLWRLPLDPAATPMGVALALGALCQGLRHAEVLRVFLARWEGGETASGAEGSGGPGAEGLATLGGYEACASVLSRQVKRRGGEGNRRERLCTCLRCLPCHEVSWRDLRAKRGLFCARVLMNSASKPIRNTPFFCRAETWCGGHKANDA